MKPVRSLIIGFCGTIILLGLMGVIDWFFTSPSAYTLGFARISTAACVAGIALGASIMVKFRLATLLAGMLIGTATYETVLRLTDEPRFENTTILLVVVILLLGCAAGALLRNPKPKPA